MDVPYVRCGACGRGLGPDGLNPTFLGRTFADMSPRHIDGWPPFVL
jgi:hypothetical protein